MRSTTTTAAATATPTRATTSRTGPGLQPGPAPQRGRDLVADPAAHRAAEPPHRARTRRREVPPGGLHRHGSGQLLGGPGVFARVFHLVHPTQPGLLELTAEQLEPTSRRGRDLLL